MISAVLTALLASCGTTPPPAPTDPGPLTYVGSTRCAECHAEQATAHASSNPALAERPATDLGAGFADPGHPTVEGEDGRPQPAPFVIGVDPLWQPLVEAERGRFQAHNMAWHPQSHAWFDIFADAREPGDWGHWTGRGMTWNTQCAHCHNTDVNAGYSSVDDSYNTTFSERGVGCEACHGRGSHHAQHPETALPAKASESCEPCHTRGSPLQTFSAELPVLDQLLPSPVGLLEDWHVDGSVATESFEGMAFQGSRMHELGVGCTACHAPHAKDADDADDACGSCHQATPAHSHHPESVDCVDCHMPIKAFMQRHPRHDHGFHIPDPQLEEELGLPSACIRCHQGEKVGEQAATWWKPAASRRRRAHAVTAARAGDPSQLASAYAAEQNIAWKAALLSMSAPWPEVLSSERQEAAKSSDDVLRLAAASSLRPDVDEALLKSLASDARLAVRLQALRRLIGILGPRDPLAEPLRTYLESQGDSPAALAELGAWWAASGSPNDAMRPLRRAIKFDPHHIDARRNLAVVLAGTGRGDLALEQIDLALTSSPEDPDLHFLRALALGGGPGTRETLEKVLSLQPGHARARYNLAVVLHQSGDEAGSLKHLVELPDHPDALGLIAQIAMNRGDKTAAIEAAQKALRLHPGQALALDVVKRLQTTPP